MKRVNKDYVFSICLLLIGVVGLTFSIISNSSKNEVNKDYKKEEEVNKEQFAMYVEDEDGNYVEYESHAFPNGYILNMDNSQCVDINNNLVDGALSNVGNNVTITSNKTIFCYLYFDKIIPIKIAIEGNGGVVPDTLGYNKTVACEDSSTAIYNTKYNRLEFTNINEEIKCTLTYTTDTNTYPTLKSIVETTGTSGNGEIVSANGYRYTGQEPNNYVWFNNELWRIIGSIPVCTTASCGTGNNLVKIIRNESIGGLAYDAKSSGYTGAWGSNTLYTLLNSYYYGKQDGTNTAYCYGYQATAKAKCNYTKIGIDASDYYGKMIEEVYWNTGASAVSTASTVYGTEIATQTVKGHIGLMAASDYGYAASSSYHSTSMSSYRTSAITLTNWLYNQGYEWTSIQNASTTTYALLVYYNGRVTNYDAAFGYAVRPVVYLDSKVYVTNGTGTVSDPYELGL